jgi:hypothetical protein
MAYISPRQHDIPTTKSTTTISSDAALKFLTEDFILSSDGPKNLPSSSNAGSGPPHFDLAITTDGSTVLTSFNKRTSSIWVYNKPVVFSATTNWTKDDIPAWQCYLCTQMKKLVVTLRVASQSTSNIKNHLKKYQKIDLFEPEDMKKQEGKAMVKSTEYILVIVTKW